MFKVSYRMHDASIFWVYRCPILLNTLHTKGLTFFHGNRRVGSHRSQAPIHEGNIMITSFAQHKCSIFFSLIIVKGTSITWQLFHPATPFCCNAYHHMNCQHAPSCWRYVVNSSQKHSLSPDAIKSSNQSLCR